MSGGQQFDARDRRAFSGGLACRLGQGGMIFKVLGGKKSSEEGPSQSGPKRSAPTNVSQIGAQMDPLEGFFLVCLSIAYLSKCSHPASQRAVEQAALRVWCSPTEQNAGAHSECSPPSLPTAVHQQSPNATQHHPSCNLLSKEARAAAALAQRGKPIVDSLAAPTKIFISEDPGGKRDSRD